MAYVYVQSKDGKPLMPTTRCGHVRHLLKTGKAKVVERNPFTVRLLYETEEITQPLYLGIDPGRTNIGVTVVTEGGTAVFSAQLETRNKEIPKLMVSRKAYRMAHRKLNRRDKRRRRARAAGTTAATPTVERILPGAEKPIVCHDIRNKEARFNNRRRKAGWLTPTANHLLQTHVNLIQKLQKYLPVSHVVLEVNRFAFMAMDNPNIQRWQYQQGPLYGIGSVKDAVFAMQEGKCLFCSRGIDHYHHVVPRRLDGSETLDNRAGLCDQHHTLVHTDEAWTAKLAAKKAGLSKRYGALGVLNQVIPYLAEELTTRFPGSCYLTTGQETHAFREDRGIAKDHHLDAYCIVCTVLQPKKVKIPKDLPCYRMVQFRRHDRQACHQQMLDRKYRLHGKVVATNRHKAMEQKTDSLGQYRANLLKEHSEAQVQAILSKLVVLEHPARYKDMQRPMPGSVFVCGNSIAVMQRSEGRHNGTPDYYHDTSGNRYRATKCKFTQNNTGIVFC